MVWFRSLVLKGIVLEVPACTNNRLHGLFSYFDLAAVKAVTASQLAMASDGVYSVTLDEAIEAMRLTARDMSVKYKETSLSGLAVCSYLTTLSPILIQFFPKTTVKIPLTSPAC